MFDARKLEGIMKQEPALRAQLLGAAIDDLRVDMSRLKTLRGQALLELRSEGRSAIEIAEALGVTRQQAHRLIREASGTPYRPAGHGPARGTCDCGWVNVEDTDDAWIAHVCEAVSR